MTHVGGFLICDKTLRPGRVTGSPEAEEFRDPSRTDAIMLMNLAIAADQDYLATILPIRDGVMVALRIR